MALLLTIATKLNEKGIRQARSAFKGLTHSLKGGIGAGLGALGLGFSIAQLTDMAKAADADSKSSALLAANLKKLGHATKDQVTQSEAFIQKLSGQIGIVDDNLRPALSELTAVTKDVTKAQKLLVAVLDISKGRGKSQEAVQKAVAKAYAGNTSALTRMFPEMKKTEAAFKATHKGALSLADSVKLGADMIQQLADQNKGNAAKMASPFDKMNVAMDNLKENIGKAIMPAMQGFVDWATNNFVPTIADIADSLGNPNSSLGSGFAYVTGNVKDLTDEMDKLAQSLGAVGGMKDIFGGLLNGVGDIISGITMKLRHFSKMVEAIKKGDFATAILEGNKIMGLGGVISTVQDFGQTQQNKENRKATNLAQLYSNAQNKTLSITINGVVGDKVAVGKAVSEALKAYNKNNGTR